MKLCKVTQETKMKCGKNICCFTCPERVTCENLDKCEEFKNQEDFQNNVCPYCVEINDEDTDLQVMEKTVPEVIRAITDITVQKKKLDEEEKLMKKKLQEAMEENNVKSFENEQVKFLYVAPTTRKSIDSTKLKKEHPEIAEAYMKESKVSGSVRITVK